MIPSWNTECGKVHGPNWAEWLADLKGKPEVHGLELGTWEGDSADWMCDNIFTGAGATYTCVDTFRGSDEHRLAGIDTSGMEAGTRSRLAKYRQCYIHKGFSHQTIKELEFHQERFHFVYVDAAHDSMNVLRDSVLAFDLLYKGGVMIWDDYTWSVMPDAVDCPQLAIVAFVQCYARQLEVIAVGSQLAARKVS